MNANELADKLEYLYQQDDADGIQMPVFLHSATMLRQQQAREYSLCSMVKEYQDKVDELRAEIEALKVAKIRAYDNGVEDGRKPDTNNEPVAWIANDADLPLKKDGSYWLYPKNPSKDNLYIPLYTHPVKEQLTDNMLWELAEKHLDTDHTWGESNVTGIGNFIEAILRKAQE